MIIVSKDNNCLVTGTVTSKGGKMQYVGEKGIPKYTFSVCYKNEKTEDDKWISEYIDCEAFGKKANVCPRVSADEMVLCAGKISTQTWSGKDGNEHSNKVLSCDFVMVSKNGSQESAQETMQQVGEFQDVTGEEDDGDLPF